MQTIASSRVLLGVLICIFLMPWIQYGLSYPNVLVTELDHCPVLACDFSRHYLPQAENWMSGNDRIASGWFYPPLLMLLITPLTFTAQPAIWWTSVNFLGIVFLSWIVSREIRGRGRFLVGLMLCMTSFPVLHGLKWGQVSIWLTVGILLFIQHRSVWVRSVSLGLVAAIKVYPLLFVLLDLLSNRLKPVMIAAVCSLCLGVLLPWLLIGDSVSIYWWAVQNGQQMVQDMAPMSGGQALAPTLHRWFISGEHIGGEWSAAPLLMYSPVMKKILLVLWLVAGVYTGFRIRHRVSTLLASTYWLLWIHLLLQPGWVHYFSFVPYVQVVLWNRVNPVGRWLIIGTIVLERIPILFLNQTVYFSFVRSGGLTLVVLLLWCITQVTVLKAQVNQLEADSEADSLDT